MDQDIESTAKKRVTLKDVAKDAEVSRATASLVLRNSPLVKEKTRRRVQESMQRLCYVYHRAAASMRSKRSRTVGLITTDITNPFFAELTIGMAAHLEAKQYAVFMSNTSEELGKQRRLLATMQEYGVDGILLCPVNDTHRADIEQLQQAHFPLVLVTRYLLDLDVDYVGIDNVYGARQAVDHLIEQGHSRIAFVGGADTSSARRDRLQGYTEGLQAQWLEPDPRMIYQAPISRDGGYVAIGQLLQQPDPPTAVLCYNDIVAFGVMAGLNAQGIDIGTEFGVIGFDDVAEARLQQPPLTTLTVPTHEIGRQAAQCLLERVEQPTAPSRRLILSPDLVVRTSSLRTD